MGKQINHVINGRGGVGKSFLATNLVQFFKDGCVAHCALDTDHENFTLKRFHSDAEFVNLDEMRGLNEKFRATETSRLVVMPQLRITCPSF